MDMLPEELVNEILLRVDRGSLFYTIQVSKQWKKLSRRQVKKLKGHIAFLNACQENDILSIRNTYMIPEKWSREGFDIACNKGYTILAKYLVHRGVDNIYLSLSGDALRNKELVKFILNTGKDKVVIDPSKVCATGDMELVNFFLNHQPYKQIHLTCGLEGACESGNVDLFNFMISKGADINNTGVIVAAFTYGHKDIVDRITIDTYKKWVSSLIGSARGGHIEVVKQMLSRFALIEYDGWYLFKAACDSGNIELVQFLIEQNICSIEEDLREITEDLVLSIDNADTITKHKYFEIIKLLITHTPNEDWTWTLSCIGDISLIQSTIDRIIFDWNEALHIAVESDNIKLANYAIENGANELNILSVCCEYASPDMLKFLIQHGAKDFNNALQETSMNHELEMAEILIKHGANNLNECLKIASSNYDLEMAELLISYGANNYNDALAIACYNNDSELIDLMVSHGAGDWNNVLRECCQRGTIDSVNFAIEHGADDWNGGLKHAFLGHQKDIMLLMIKRGANNFLEIFHMFETGQVNHAYYSKDIKLLADTVYGR